MGKSKNFKSIAEQLINILSKKNIKAYHAATTGSCYIRFEDERIGSVRLGDHSGRSKLKYKFNIRSDYPKGYKKWRNHEGMWRYYVSTSNWLDIIPILENRAIEVKKWEKGKFTYGIPKYKRILQNNQ